MVLAEIEPVLGDVVEERVDRLEGGDLRVTGRTTTVGPLEDGERPLVERRAGVDDDRLVGEQGRRRGSARRGPP